MHRLGHQIPIQPLGPAFAAETRFLDPAERHVVRRDDEAVDPDHPAFDAVGDAVDAAAILGEGEGGEAIGQPVRLLERLFLGAKRADQRHRAEGFIVHRVGLDLDLVEIAERA